MRDERALRDATAKTYGALAMGSVLTRFNS